MALNANTLVQSIETFLEQEWQTAKGEALATEGREDLQLMFKAIAQGVVKHLRDNAEVLLTDAKHDHTHTITCDVDVENKTEGGSSLSHDHKATCSVTIADHKHLQKGKIN
jgi:hypothetical protein